MLLFSDKKLSAYAEAVALHRPKNAGMGFISMGYKHTLSGQESGIKLKNGKPFFEEKFFNVGAITKDLMAALGSSKAETYISQASFIGQKRGNTQISKLACVFVDLDVYKAGLEPDDSTILKVQEVAIENGFPLPTYITKSGRGLYAKWIFEEPITATQIPMWKKLQNVLRSLYTPFGADPVVKDPARILRLPGTTNNKSGTIVEALEIAGKMYQFADLCEKASHIKINPALIQATYQKAKVRRAQKELGSLGEFGETNFDLLDEYQASKEPFAMGFSKRESLSWARFIDLRDLFAARKGIKTGMRDLAAFWMTDLLSHSGIIDSENFESEVKSLLSSFPKSADFSPLDDGSLGTLFRRIKAREAGEKVVYDGVAYDPVYTASNDFLINAFEVTDEEMASLSTIISSDEKRRRADQKAPGRETRRTERNECKFAAVALHDMGKSIDEICAEVQRSKSTVYRWLQKDATVDRPYVETRGQRKKQATRSPYVKYKITGSGLVAHDPQVLYVPRTELTAEELKKRVKIREEAPHRNKKLQWTQAETENWLEKRRNAKRLAYKAILQAKVAANEAAALNRARISSSTDELAERLQANLHSVLAKRTISISDSACVSLDDDGPPYRERHRI